MVLEEILTGGMNVNWIVHPKIYICFFIETDIEKGSIASPMDAL